jgi:hypothetical protein
MSSQLVVAKAVARAALLRRGEGMSMPLLPD